MGHVRAQAVFNRWFSTEVLLAHPKILKVEVNGVQSSSTRGGEVYGKQTRVHIAKQTCDCFKVPPEVLVQAHLWILTIITPNSNVSVFKNTDVAASRPCPNHAIGSRAPLLKFLEITHEEDSI